jgi:hypothetical protein
MCELDKLLCTTDVPEKRLTVGFEVSLVLVEHAIEPWEQFLGAVVGVEDNGDTIDWRNGADIMRSSNSTSDTGFLLLIWDALAYE